MTTTSSSRAMVGSIESRFRCVRPLKDGHETFFLFKSLCELCELCVLRGDRPLQQSRVERQRQQLFQCRGSRLLGEVGEDDFEVAAELPEDLAARAARRCR